MDEENIIKDLLSDLMIISEKYCHDLGVKVFTHELLVFTLVGVMLRTPSKKAAEEHIEECIAEVNLILKELDDEK